MKHPIALRAISLASVLFIYTLSSGQAMAVNNSKFKSDLLYASAVNLLSEENAVIEDFPDPDKTVSKSYRNFNRDFRNAKEITSAEIINGTLIYCTINQVRHQLFYGKKGNLYATIKYYGAEKLDVGIRNMILDAYKGYQIFGVTEVSAPSGLVHLVKIESMSTWKTIHVSSDSMKETESFQK